MFGMEEIKELSLNQNATADFLGHAYSWPRTKIYFEQLHPVDGGFRLSIHSWGSYFVRFVSPGGAEESVRLPLTQPEKEALVGLFVKYDFINIKPPERNGRPLEARPIISLRTDGGREHAVSKWAEVPDERFDALAAVLHHLVEKARPGRAGHLRWGNVQIGLLWGSLLIGLLAPFVVGYFTSGWLIEQFWPTRPLTVLSLLFLIWLFIPLLGGFFRWQEQHKRRGRRIFHNRWVLMAISIVQGVAIVQLLTVPWLAGIDSSAVTITLVMVAGTALMGTLIALPVLAWRGGRLLRLMDERL